jgi:hypothetical protein
MHVLRTKAFLYSIFLVSFSAAINGTTTSPSLAGGAVATGLPPHHCAVAGPAPPFGQFFRLSIFLCLGRRVYQLFSLGIVMLTRGFGAFVSQHLVLPLSIEIGSQALESSCCLCIDLPCLWLC